LFHALSFTATRTYFSLRLDEPEMESEFFGNNRRGCWQAEQMIGKYFGAAGGGQQISYKRKMRTPPISYINTSK
jgi:hypothetical protein